ncbi:MAG TPA: glycoside hydrolase family 3 C-terminal domain-containing protein, partial [Polyangia bacterium]|nr:glycoside hydrolase family 3 C-terminal domain-containing protein [Polyangia bacterium]
YVSPPYAVTVLNGIQAAAHAVEVDAVLSDAPSADQLERIAAADAAIVVVGLTTKDEGEGQIAAGDRAQLELSAAQEQLVLDVAAVNPRTIVVMVSSFPQGIGPIDDSVPAILHVANSGQELGNAVADVLFGDYNPGGHTTVTWYRNTTDLPNEITDYDITKGMTYWYFTGTPLYPFGHGLSYSTFEYSNLTLSAPSLDASCGTVDVGVDVTNTSAVEGDEVVQLYLSYPDSGVQRPLQQLRGFRRVTIAPGETARVTMSLHSVDLSYWDEKAGRFTVEAGKPVDLQVGASSRDIRLRGTLSVTP